MVNPTILAEELQLPAYGGLLPSSPGMCVFKMNTLGSGFKTVSKEIGIGSILDALGPTEGSNVLNRLEMMKSTSSMVKWAFYLLEKGTLDIGLASTRAAIDGLAAGGVMTVEQAGLIKDLANVSASRSEVLFGNGVSITEADVRLAMGL